MQKKTATNQQRETRAGTSCVGGYDSLAVRYRLQSGQKLLGLLTFPPGAVPGKAVPRDKRSRVTTAASAAAGIGRQRRGGEPGGAPGTRAV